MLRDFEEAGELVICKEFGQDIAEIAQLAQQIDEKGLLQAVALDPYGVGAIVDALYEVGISGQDTHRWHLAGLEAVRRDQDSRAQARRQDPASRRSRH